MAQLDEDEDDDEEEDEEDGGAKEVDDDVTEGLVEADFGFAVVVVIAGALWRLAFLRPAFASANRRAGPPPADPCVLVCLLRWSDRIKDLLQIGQANFFSPV